MKPARDVYLDHFGACGFWIENLNIKEPSVRPDIRRAAVFDMLFFIRRCRV